MSSTRQISFIRWKGEMKFQVEGLNVGIEDMIILGFTWIKAGIPEEGIGQ